MNCIARGSTVVFSTSASIGFTSTYTEIAAQQTKLREMRILRRDWVKFRFVGCGIWVVAAILLYQIEVDRKNTETAKPNLETEDWLPHDLLETAYESSETEKHIVSHIAKELANFTSKDSIQIELVGCHLRLWFATSQYAVLSRSFRNFAGDDNFAHRHGFAHKSKVVFLCYNHTYGYDVYPDGLTKSSFLRYPVAKDLLIVMYKNSSLRPSIAKTFAQVAESLQGGYLHGIRMGSPR